MTTEELIAKYGEPGTRQVYCHLAYPMRLAWDTSVSIIKFSCHEEVKEQLEAIFEETLQYYGDKQEIARLGLDLFGGCLNIRNKRGGNTLSMHSWGLAVDLDPVHNQLRWDKTRAKFAKPEYRGFWEIVENNGAYSLGRIKDYDWMHFQFVPV